MAAQLIAAMILADRLHASNTHKLLQLQVPNDGCLMVFTAKSCKFRRILQQSNIAWSKCCCCLHSQDQGLFA